MGASWAGLARKDSRMCPACLAATAAAAAKVASAGGLAAYGLTRFWKRRGGGSPIGGRDEAPEPSSRKE